ncbi:hypothetical protein [Granulicella rosea]|uniref:hypothetical protein n=1 Tax=Granulicella rosea TaxID=474952 RepID=UPI00115DDABE|nr:hypothetical protein [Granulicella rosea]
MKDTHGRYDWTTENLSALRAFADSTQHPYTLKSYPPVGSNQKGAFLWDYVAYQQGTGILITAESEFDNLPGKLREDFDKLLYVHSPIKLFIFRMEKNLDKIARVVDDLTTHMDSCKTYSPADVYVLYCRTWRNNDQSSGDLAWLQQIGGKPMHRDVCGKGFVQVLPQKTPD